MSNLWRRINTPPWAPKRVNRWIVAWGEYKVDRRILLGAVAIILLLGWAIAYDEFGPWWRTGQIEKTYIRCPESSVTPCENPLYGQCLEWYCIEPYYQPGFTYGEPPGTWYMTFGFVALMIMALALVINHFVHNRNFEFNLEE